MKLAPDSYKDIVFTWYSQPSPTVTMTSELLI